MAKIVFNELISNQNVLFPVSLSDKIPFSHPVRIVNNVACHLNIDCRKLDGLEVIQDPENRNVYTIITDHDHNEDGKKRMVWEFEEENGRYKVNKILTDYHFR